MKALYKILALSAVVALTGCAKETATKDAETVNTGKVSILVSSNATKSVLDGTAINWANGDAIVVNDGSADHTYTYSGEDEANKVVFEGEDELTTNTNYAFFPSVATFSGSTATFTVAESQDGTGANIPMYAYSTENPCVELEFDVAAAVLKFQVAATTMPSAIKFAANGIAGESTVDVTSGTVGTGKSNAVTVETNFAKKTDYYVVVLPGTYADGIQISCDDVDYLAPKKDITLEAGKLYDMGTINLNTWKLVASDEDVKNGEYMIAIWEGTTLKVLSLKNLASNADKVASTYKDGEGIGYYKQNAKNIYNTLVKGNYLDVTGNHKGTAFTGGEKLITLPDEAETAVSTITMTDDNVTVANGSYSFVLEKYGVTISDGTATITGRPQAESVVSILTTMNGNEPAWSVQTVVDYFADSDLARKHLYNMLSDMGYNKTDKLTDLYKDEYATDAFQDFYLANVVFDTSKDGYTVRCKTWKQMDQFVQVFIPQIQGYLEKTTAQLQATDYAKLAAYINEYLGQTVTADQIKAAFEDTTVDGTANWDALIAEYKTKINNWISKAETYVGKASDQSSKRYTQVQLWYKVGSGE